MNIVSMSVEEKQIVYRTQLIIIAFTCTQITHIVWIRLIERICVLSNVLSDYIERFYLRILSVIAIIRLLTLFMYSLRRS